MEKQIVFPFSFFNLKNEKRKTNRFSFILLHFLHVKCNCGIVHAPLWYSCEGDLCAITTPNASTIAVGITGNIVLVPYKDTECNA